MSNLVDPVQYARLFQRDPAGEAIFLELYELFYSQQSHTPGDPYNTAFKEGQRAVLAFITNKIAAAKQPEPEQQEE